VEDGSRIEIDAEDICAQAPQTLIRYNHRVVLGSINSPPHIHFWVQQDNGIHVCIGELQIAQSSPVTCRMQVNAKTSDVLLQQAMVDFGRRFGPYLNSLLFAKTFGEQVSSVMREFVSVFEFTRGGHRQ